jgi:hypothetical protein
MRLRHAMTVCALLGAAGSFAFAAEIYRRLRAIEMAAGSAGETAEAVRQFVTHAPLYAVAQAALGLIFLGILLIAVVGRRSPVVAAELELPELSRPRRAAIPADAVLETRPAPAEAAVTEAPPSEGCGSDGENSGSRKDA